MLAIKAHASKRNVLAELSVAAGSMSQEAKEKIVEAAYLMLIADEYVAPPELKMLKDIAAALRISDDRLEAIMAVTEPPST